MLNALTTCLNCEHVFDGRFCNRCGQKAETHRFTMHEWLHEIPHSLFHVDGGFFYTFWNLCTRPGIMIREYIDGRRKTYFSPFLYVLIWCGVFVVTSSLFAKSTAEKPVVTDFFTAYGYLQSSYYKPLVVAMILPVSLGSFLIFRRAKFYFAEHLVLNTFVISQMIIADIVLFLISSLPQSGGYKGAAAALNFFLKFPFWIWVYWQFFKPKNALLGAAQIFLSILVSTTFTELMTAAIAFLILLIKSGAH